MQKNPPDKPAAPSVPNPPRKGPRYIMGLEPARKPPPPLRKPKPMRRPFFWLYYTREARRQYLEEQRKAGKLRSGVPEKEKPAKSGGDD